MVEESNFKHIIRVAQVDIPGEKHIAVSLTHIKGVGKNIAHILCNLANIDHATKAGTLQQDQIDKLSELLLSAETILPVWMLNRRRDHDSGEDKHLLTGKLDFTKANDIKRFQKIKCLRGIRHQRRLPVRGQRTKSNFRRTKGKAVGVKKKK